MGDTLVYTKTSAAVPPSPQDTLFAGAFAQSQLPAALAAAATTSLSANSRLARMSIPQHPQISPSRERRATDFSSSTMIHTDLDGATQKPAVLIRKLPRNINNDGVANLLLFAKDLSSVKLIDFPEDGGFATAVAQFNSYAGAKEVKDSLDGKINSTNDAKLIVEIPPAGSSPTDMAARLGSRRSTIDGTAAARSAGASSNSSGMDGVSRQPSRFSSTFQQSSNDRISPPQLTKVSSNGEYASDGGKFSAIFSPQSPAGHAFGDRQHNLGKSVINDDVDDETDGLLRDPLAYARNGRPANTGRQSMSQVPTAQFSNLSITPNGYDGGNPLSGPNSGLTSPAPNSAQHSNGTPFSARGNHHGSYGSSTPMNGQGRTSYPAANPADQNPPCNTLYVGNLPNNTSEDELKRLFSQQRGYKRLCFRTKQNGPMCFVEFENVTLATQALHHMYGTLLSNSVKGGIRLSFSKNPLGVRNGQGGMPPNAMNMNGPYGGFGNDIAPPPGFSAPSAPPPGLQQGGRGGMGYGRPPPHMPDGMGPMYQAHQYSMSGAPFASQLRMPYQNNSPSPSANGPGQNY